MQLVSAALAKASGSVLAILLPFLLVKSASARVLVHQSCIDLGHGDAIKSAIDDAARMGQVARDHMSESDDTKRIVDAKDDVGLFAELFQKGQSPNPRDAVTQVFDKVANIQMPVNDKDKITIFCGEGNLRVFDADPQMPDMESLYDPDWEDPNGIPTSLWASAPAPKGQAKAYCAENPKPYAYVVNGGDRAPHQSHIFLCQLILDQYFPSSPPPVSAYDTRKIQDIAAKGLDNRYRQLDQILPLATLIFHEFIHTVSVSSVDSNGVPTIMDGRTGKTGNFPDGVYGYRLCSQSRPNALSIADSYAVLARGLNLQFTTASGNPFSWKSGQVTVDNEVKPPPRSLPPIPGQPPRRSVSSQPNLRLRDIDLVGTAGSSAALPQLRTRTRSRRQRQSLH